MKIRIYINSDERRVLETRMPLGIVYQFGSNTFECSDTDAKRLISYFRKVVSNEKQNSGATASERQALRELRLLQDIASLLSNELSAKGLLGVNIGTKVVS